MKLHFSDKTIIFKKIGEAFASVMPITAIVLLLCFTVTPISSGAFLSLIFGAVLLVVGMGLFTLGADTAMTPIGEYVGATAIRSRKIPIIVPICFVVGILITVSEPDLQVLAGQIPNIPNAVLILAVGVGVGVFLVIAFLRIVLKVRLAYLLLFFYTIVFAMSFFVPDIFVPLAFDAGGVTTGPMSVPFIIAIGTGISAMRNDKNAGNDSFGLIALCSIGPILSVMVLGITYRPENIPYTFPDLVSAATSRELIAIYLKALPEYFGEVGLALLPIVLLFFIFRLAGQKIGKSQFVKILVGILYTYIGLVLFLTGVNIGFMPAGRQIGKLLGELPFNWIVVPTGMLIGFFVVAAEPAVHVLTGQVYDITSGAVPKRVLRLALMIGVAVSVGLAMLRILLHVSILWFLIPGYFIAVILCFFSPDIFTAIAFDSGGVVSGAMTASFLLPLALGLCSAVGGNVAADGFGVVAMVAMTPLITVQIIGMYYKIKTAYVKKSHAAEQEEATEEIIG